MSTPLHEHSADCDWRTVPRHVACIMDGNGRWAAERNLPRWAGHRQGILKAREIAEILCQIGVRYVTLFAFSTENWQRPKAEVRALLRLFEWYLTEERERLLEQQIRFRLIGQRWRLPPAARALVAEVERLTAECRRMDLLMAVSYGGRDEITSAVRALGSEILEHKLHPDNVTDELLARYLAAPDVPDPDLLIRTGGEQRISNFLLWQLAYTELAFIPSYWPSFSEAELRRCLGDFATRKRRYGKT